MAVRSNTAIMLVSSSLMIGSKGYPETSFLAYNNRPRHNPKELHHQIHITSERADELILIQVIRMLHKQIISRPEFEMSCTLLLV